MLLPKKVKHRKQHKRKFKRLTKRGEDLKFGNIGLKALESDWIPSKQIEAARRAITHHIQRQGKLWIRIFPDSPITQKGAETPMGKGKGDVSYFAAFVDPGRILFEMDGVAEKIAKEAFKRAAAKLSVKTRVVLR